MSLNRTIPSAVTKNRRLKIPVKYHAIRLHAMSKSDLWNNFAIKPKQTFSHCGFIPGSYSDMPSFFGRKGSQWTVLRISRTFVWSKDTIQ